MSRDRASRGKWFPGTRLFLYVGGLLGLVRAAGEAVEEERRAKESVDPTTYSSHDELDTKLVWKIGMAVLLGIWVIVALMSLLFNFFKYDRTGGRAPAKVLAYVPPLPPQPRNVNEPYQYLDKFVKREAGEMDSYDWVDRNKGIVSIPIGRAMQLVAERGIPPSPPPANPNKYYPPTAASLRTGFEGKVEPEP